MDEFWLDGDAAGGGDGSQLTPFNSAAQLPHTNGLFADDTTLNFKAGAAAAVAMNTGGAGFRPPSGGSLIVRAYGGGGRPQLTFTGRGFVASGVGSQLTVQDVEMLDAGAADQTAITSTSGGSLTVQRTRIEGFFNHIKGGTGTVLIEDNELWHYAWNGIMIDAEAAYALGTGGIIRRNSITAATDDAAGQDPIVLHDGGYGLGTGWIIEDNAVHAGNPESESGLDLQQQFRGAIVRRNLVYGASQWALAQGSLFKGGVTRVMSTRTAMLAYFNREKYIGNAVLPGDANVINGGHCCWVTSDGANNGLYQLTGSDPRELADWTGPMAAADLLTLKTLVYQNLFEGHGGGIQLQHPGTECVANDVRGITMVHGAALKLYDMAYGIKAWDNEFESSGGASSTRALVRVDALESRIAATTRGTLKNNKLRMASSKTGAFLDLAAAADLSYLVTDHDAYLRPTLGSFASVASVAKTFAEFKAANGGSDANSQHITIAAALIDSTGHLLDSSPLIGAGATRSGLDGSIPAVDVEGNAVSSPSDIGGYRYLSSSAAAAVAATPRRKRRAPRSAPGSGGGSAAPGAVTGLTLAAATATTLAFTWAEVANAGYYELRYSLAGADDWTTDAQHFTTEAGSITVPAAFTAYDVQARGVNAADGPWSDSVEATTAAAVWLRPQDSTNTAGFDGLPALVPKFMAAGITSNPDAYDVAGVYTLPSDNGGSGGGVALVAVDDNVARRLDAVLTMVGMAAGRHWLIAQRASHQAAGVRSFYFGYGAHSSQSSCYGVQVATDGGLGFMSRGLGASSSTLTTLAHDSGPTYDDFEGQGDYTVLLGLRAVSDIEVDVELRIIHPTVGTSIWSGSAVDCSFGADAATLPGITAGQAASEHGGLMIGGRMRSVSVNYVPELLLGTGTGHVATLADFQACVYADFNAARIDAAEAAILAAPTVWCLG